MAQNNLSEPLLTQDHPPIIKWLIVIAVSLLLVVLVLVYFQWPRGPEVVPENGQPLEVSAADRQQIIELLNQPARPVTKADRAAILKLLES